MNKVTFVLANGDKNESSTSDHDYEEGETLLALSKREEIPVPFGCYAGHCAACMVRVDTTTEGAANLPAPTVFETYTLTREELDAGWRLGCQLELGSGALRIEPWAPGLE